MSAQQKAQASSQTAADAQKRAMDEQTRAEQAQRDLTTAEKNVETARIRLRDQRALRASYKMVDGKAKVLVRPQANLQDRALAARYFLLVRRRLGHELRPTRLDHPPRNGATGEDAELACARGIPGGHCSAQLAVLHQVEDAEVPEVLPETEKSLRRRLHVERLGEGLAGPGEEPQGLLHALAGGEVMNRQARALVFLRSAVFGVGC